MVALLSMFFLFFRHSDYIQVPYESFCNVAREMSEGPEFETPEAMRSCVCGMCMKSHGREVSRRALHVHRPARLVCAVTRDPGSKKAGQN